MAIFFSPFDALVAVMVTLYLLKCPFSKVEESFNLQATHDILEFGILEVHKYDHFEFPGVVPRTFLGALSLATIAMPFATVMKFFGFPKIYLQYLVRWILGMAGVGALKYYSIAVTKRFGKGAGRFFMLVCACQFHLMFYMSRTLPNIFGLILVLIGLASWIQDKTQVFIYIFSFTTIVFRGDTAILFASILLFLLLTRKISFFQTVIDGFVATLGSLVLTVLVDSWFWQRWLWPEGEVLYFNTILNKSHEWGVHPPFWYFYSALPRALLLTALLIPFGVSSLLPALFKARNLKQIKECFAVAPLLDASVCTFVVPVLVYLLLFSILPHKELRFIFNALPILNMAAAIGFSKLYHDRHKAFVPFVCACACLLATFLGSFFFLTASQVNYPGGKAFRFLHDVTLGEQDMRRRVHIDVSSAMTGVSRFGEENIKWKYSKQEDLKTKDQLSTFDYLLTATNPKKLAPEFQLMQSFDVFERPDLNTLQVKTKKYIHVLRNSKTKEPTIINSSSK